MQLPADDAAAIAQKFARAKTAQLQWRHTPVAERLEKITHFYHLLDTEKDTLAQDLTAETGKPLQQAFNELNGARTRIRFFLEHTPALLEEEWITKEGATREKITYEPLGVIANISAWNYPYLVGVNVFIPALLAGNAVLYKPSEYALLTGRHIARLLHQSGIPEAVFQCITGSGEAGQALLELPLQGYYFTGSYATGQHIARALAGKMVPVQMELGGKDPLYVMDDVADIKAAAGAVLEGITYNAGQSCCAVERIYVHEKVYEAFTASIAEQAAAIKVGNPMQADTDLGPLCRPQQVEVIKTQIKDALEKGATVLYQTPTLPAQGYYVPITLLTNVNHSMLIMQEESFGPVCGIQKVTNDEEAITLMLDTPYGLTAAVYGSSFERAERIMQKMNTGTVYFNCCDRVSAALPWSGRGQSGIGSTLSFSGIRAFTQPKAWHLR
jgi:acyl-CoA reductase-like NAD-dependent aldehyde dehydrogenase